MGISVHWPQPLPLKTGMPKPIINSTTRQNKYLHLYDPFNSNKCTAGPCYNIIFNAQH